MPDAGAKAGTFDGALFASVLHARARQAMDRGRALWLVPLAIGVHVVALLGLASLWHGGSRAPDRATDDTGALVLRLVSAPSPPPPAATAASTPATVARRMRARRHRPFPEPTVPKSLPTPVESPTPPLEEPRPSPSAPPEAPGTDAMAGGPAGTRGGVAGGVVGGLVQGVLGANKPGLLFAPPPPRPTPRQLTTWREEYFETMFRDRFENVRYPHQAAMAGIEGKLVVRISVGARGQVLELEVLGYCPHSVLCDAAMKAVRDAAPFPPPPPELGGSVTVELPFNYHLR
jgi:protein TonB